jgi:hypothetical protein
MLRSSDGREPHLSWALCRGIHVQRAHVHDDVVREAAWDCCVLINRGFDTRPQDAPIRVRIVRTDLSSTTRQSPSIMRVGTRCQVPRKGAVTPVVMCAREVARDYHVRDCIVL